MKKVLLLCMLSLLIFSVPSHGQSAAAVDSTELAAVNPPSPNDYEPVEIKDTTIIKEDSVIHVGTSEKPPLMWKLPEETGGSILTCLVVFLGLFAHYFVEWTKKQKREPAAKFNGSIWIKDNWKVVVLYVAGVCVLYGSRGSMSVEAAFMSGFVPSALIDWVRKMTGSTT